MDYCASSSLSLAAHHRLHSASDGRWNDRFYSGEGRQRCESSSLASTRGCIQGGEGRKCTRGGAAAECLQRRAFWRRGVDEENERTREERDETKEGEREARPPAFPPFWLSIHRDSALLDDRACAEGRRRNSSSLLLSSSLERTSSIPPSHQQPSSLLRFSPPPFVLVPFSSR